MTIMIISIIIMTIITTGKTTKIRSILTPRDLTRRWGSRKMLQMALLMFVIQDGSWGATSWAPCCRRGKRGELFCVWCLFFICLLVSLAWLVNKLILLFLFVISFAVFVVCVCLCVWFFVYLSIRLSACLSVCQSVCLFPSLCLYIPLTLSISSLQSASPPHLARLFPSLYLFPSLCLPLPLHSSLPHLLVWLSLPIWSLMI